MVSSVNRIRNVIPEVVWVGNFAYQALKLGMPSSFAQSLLLSPGQFFQIFHDVVMEGGFKN
jgi:hypothetical protein